MSSARNMTRLCLSLCLNLLSCHSIKPQPVYNTEWGLCCTQSILQAPQPKRPYLTLVWEYAIRASLLKTTMCLPNTPVCYLSLFICWSIYLLSLCIAFVTRVLAFLSLFISHFLSIPELCYWKTTHLCKWESITWWRCAVITEYLSWHLCWKFAVEKKTITFSSH